MSFEDDPYLRRDRAAHWRLVGGVVFALLVGTASLAMRCGRERRARDAIRARLSAAPTHPQAFPSWDTPPPPVVDDAPLPDQPPVAFALARAQSTVELDGLAITLDAARQLVVTPQDEWVFSTPRWSLTYPSAMQTAAIGDGLQLSTRGGSVDLTFATSAEAPADVAAQMAATYDAPGQRRERTIRRRTILHREVEVTRIVTSGPAVELAVVPIDKRRHLRILVQTVEPRANPAWLWEVVGTLRLQARPSQPELLARIVDANGLALETVDVTIGTPFSIGGETMTVTRRPTVRERRIGISFERPLELTTITTTSSIPTVLLRGTDVAFQIMHLPRGMAAEALPGILRDARPIERRFAGVDYAGSAGTMPLGAQELPTEMFVITRGGSNFVVVIQALEGQHQLALRYAEVVIPSLR